MAKYTLLEIVQNILSDMDSEDINSVGDTSESLQVANVVQDTYYNMISNRTVPEHTEMFQLTAESDSSTPTHFTYPSGVVKVDTVWYDVSDDATFKYREITWYEPEAFLRATDGSSSDYTSVTDPVSSTNLRITNNEHPSFYTSFDDNYIVMNAHKSTIDSTLTAAKSRALGIKVPSFSITDAHTPDIDDNYFPLLIAESKSACFSIFKGAIDPKIEQGARRQRSRVQNDVYKTTKDKVISNYGR
jgi:hypothetical protein